MRLLSSPTTALLLAFSLLQMGGGISTTIKPSATEPGSQACATVSKLLAAHASASPSARPLSLPADLAFECSQSAKVVTQDALDLIDGLTAFLQWQSTLAYLKDPPPGYLLLGVDLLAGMDNIRNQVSANDFSSEIDFETSLTELLGSAHDGHLAFFADGLNIFHYFRSGLGNLVSVSEDGQTLPEIYSSNDLAAQQSSHIDWTPSPIVKIDGQNASLWLSNLAINGTDIGLQDPDAMYNSLFLEAANFDSTQGEFFVQNQGYLGPSVNATFANGTDKQYPNYATTEFSFDGVDSGEAFYFKFCNSTQKLMSATASASATSTLAKRLATATSAVPTPASTPIVAPRTQYPAPVVVSPDGTIAGYFLNGTGYENTAVLSILMESETDIAGCKRAMSDFLALCRRNEKTYLVIDLSSNPGGTIVLGYEYFKQLFPSLNPYGAGTFRATAQYDILGQTITTFADKSKGYVNFTSNGGYTIFDGTAYDDETGEPFTSWADYFGPVTHYGDNFTHLTRYNLSDAKFDEAMSGYGIVVSGFANDTNIPPQPFKPENMILLSDGACSSTCTTFAHLMKWQGKVKSLAIGGRPQNGPMQAVGGVKGKQVYGLEDLYYEVQGLYSVAQEEVLVQANQTGLKTILDLGQYVISRCLDPNLANSMITINLQNSIAEDDKTFTPLQFVYEAADCRLWWTKEMIFNINSVWKAAAEQAFGLNGHQVFDGCVPGSTNQKSSLSGNAVLDNGGTGTNVTQFVPDGDVANATATGAAHNKAARGYGGPYSTMTLILSAMLLGWLMMG